MKKWHHGPRHSVPSNFTFEIICTLKLPVEGQSGAINQEKEPEDQKHDHIFQKLFLLKQITAFLPNLQLIF